MLEFFNFEDKDVRKIMNAMKKKYVERDGTKSDNTIKSFNV